MNDHMMLEEIRDLLAEYRQFGITDADAADTLTAIDDVLHGIHPDTAAE